MTTGDSIESISTTSEDTDLSPTKENIYTTGLVHTPSLDEGDPP